MSPWLLFPIYGALSLAPLILAWAQGLPPRSFRDELASGLALSAFAVLLLEFVLSGRIRAVSRRIGSDVTMRVHQLLARAVLVAALLHPLLYVTPYATALPFDPSRRETLLYQVDYLFAGTLALVVIVGFVLMGIGRDRLPMRYEGWRATHALGALLLAAAVAYHAFVGGRYSADPALAAFWAMLLAIAAGSLLHVYVLRPLLRRARPYRVVSVKPVAERSWELVVKPDGGRRLDFRAGQFVWLNVGHSPFSLAENPFSIASAPSDREAVSFMIKEAGDFTGQLGSIVPGTRAFLDGPHGALTLERHPAPGIVLVAGGVGLAPLLSMLRELRHRRDGRPLILVYGNRAATQIAYAAELEALQSVLDLRVVHVLREPPPGWAGATGFITDDVLRQACGGRLRPDWLHVVCGPAPMLISVVSALRAGGVPAGNILSERFDYD